MNQRITRIVIAFLATAIGITIIGIIAEVVFSFVIHNEKSHWDESELISKFNDQKPYRT